MHTILALFYLIFPHYNSCYKSKAQLALHTILILSDIQSKP